MIVSASYAENVAADVRLKLKPYLIKPRMDTR
jgi:hypothetical protein